jgi:spermidine/putrescine transport system ATP-binding protein
MALLEIREVSRRFGGRIAVERVSLSIGAGEFFTLLGPSGCGKTTLLRMIAGFDQPDSGTLLLDGAPLEAVPPERRPIRMVFQSYALFPHMTVEGNVAFPLEMEKRPRAEIRERVAQALELVRLGDRPRNYPHELSGGQKQRVALARALVGRPRLLLLDEPLAALDAKLREQMRGELIRLQREVGVTFIFVTHAQDEALALSHRIAVMNAGRVEQVDRPDRVYAAPANRFVAGFVGKSNLLEVEVEHATHTQLELEAPRLGRFIAGAASGVKAGDRGVFALRPELVRLTTRPGSLELHNRFAGRVRESIYQGDVTLHTVELEGGFLLEAMVPNALPGETRALRPGDEVAAAWRHDVGVFLRE